MDYDAKRRRLAALEGIEAEDVRDLRAGHTPFYWNQEQREALRAAVPTDDPPGAVADMRQALNVIRALDMGPELARVATLSVLGGFYAAHPDAIPCARCGFPCELAPPETDRPEVTLLRGRSTPGEGVCPSCQITAFLQDPDYPLSRLYAEMSPEQREQALLTPHMQENTAQLVRHQPGGMGLPPEMIVWERVAFFWDVPHPEGTYGKRGRRRGRRKNKP